MYTGGKDGCELALHTTDAGGLLWAAEPTSSKDTASRMNSPRISKSSGTGVRSCDKDNSSDRDLDAVSSRSDQDGQHDGMERLESPGLARDALEDISNVVSSSQQDLLPSSSSREGCSPSSPAAKQSSRSPSASVHGASSQSGASAERDAVATEMESRVVSPPEDSPEGATCPEALREGSQDHVDAAMDPSDCFLLSPSGAKPQTKAKGSKRPCALTMEMTVDMPCKERPEAPPQRHDLRLVARPANAAEGCEELSTPAQSEPPLPQSGDALEGGNEKPPILSRALLEAECLSRAASAVPGADVTEGEGGSNVGGGDAEPEEEEEEKEVVPRRPRGKASKRKPPLSARRSARVAGLEDDALGAASDDEDYCPPGEADEAAPAKRQRLRARGSAPLLSTPEACASLITRGSSRLRWSNTMGAVGTPPPAPPLSGGSRRLRSQPVDLTCLRPDAFAFSPAPKRARTSQLQAAVANLELLRSQEGTTLARSSASGICKPYPLWLGPLDAQLRACAEDACRDALQGHASDLRLLDGGRLPAPSRVEAGQRLGSNPLGKAMRRAGDAKAVEASPDQLLPACQSLFPEFLQPALAYWEERLQTPCQGAHGEATTCLMARKERDLQNTWEDLLARHAAEAGALEGLRQWLLPTDDSAE